MSNNTRFARVFIVAVVLLLGIIMVSTDRAALADEVEAQTISRDAWEELEAQLRFEFAVNIYNLSIERVHVSDGRLAGIVIIEHPSDPNSIHNLRIPFVAIRATETGSVPIVL